VLTVVLPTRNRSAHCASLLRYLRKNGFAYPIVVLDASDATHAEAVRAACAGVAEYRHFGPEFRMVDKLVAAVGTVETPYIVLMPDDDPVMPHAVEAALAFLQHHPDYVVAHGYFLGFGMDGVDFEIHSVIGFTSSIDSDDPLRRHAALFERYQSFYWGVFRTDVFATAVTAAQAMNVVLFRELTVMSTSILQGKVARLPIVYALRGTATSHAIPYDSHPLLWVLRNAESFFRHYLIYRNALVRFIEDRGIAVPPGTQLEQLLDMSHASWLAREADMSKINLTTHLLLDRMELDENLLPFAIPRWTGGRALDPDDVRHLSIDGRRLYVWRRDVIQAEPAHEIAISQSEMASVERQLDAYRLSKADQIQV